MTNMESVSFKEFVVTVMKSCQDLHLTKIEALEKKIELNLRLNQVALDKADEKLDERLLRMNEFREALKDQAAKFVTRDELQLTLDSMSKDIRDLRESKARLEGKADMSAVYGAYGLSIVAILINVIFKLF